MKQIQIECDPSYNCPDIKYCKTIVTTVLTQDEVKNANINVIFGSEKLISDLKKQYFQVDQWTDVIAFRLNAYDQSEVEGEVYISLPTARISAKEYNESYEREVARLIIHGTLHLLGYKDELESDKQEMTAMEEYYLGEANWKELFGT